MSVRRLAGFGRGWFGGGAVVSAESPIALPDGSEVAAIRFAPAAGGPHPAWIALHGLTRPGPSHPTLVHFARALAASGAVVVVPDIHPWRDLVLDPTAADPVVRSTLDALDRDPDVRGSPGLIGFSFGGPQTLRIAADPELGSRLAGVASFGGFADIEALVRFQMTGIIATDQGPERLRPDPYGRWIIAANYLTHADGCGHLGDVADALRELARTAGDRRTVSWDPIYDPLKDELEASIEPAHREVFRLFAPPSGIDPVDRHADVERWVARLVDAARRREPGLEPAHGLELRAPAHILHGRNDNLIPWTEAAAVSARIRSPKPTTTVTALFGHSGRDSGGRVADALESVRLANALRRVLAIP